MKLQDLIKQQDISLNNDWLLEYADFNELDTNDEELENKINDIFSDYVSEQCDVTYYADAIQFLAEHDTSLERSLELTQGWGSVNSCILAAELKADMYRDDLQDDIAAILEAIELTKESK